MKKQQKEGLISLVVMIALTIVLIFSSNAIYSSITGDYSYKADVAGAGESEGTEDDAAIQAEIDAAIANASGSYTAGTYEGTATGFEGDVTVTITASDKAITDITIVGEGETPAIGGNAMKQMRNAMLIAQSEDVDGIASATFTSDAVLKGAKIAFCQARGEEVPVEEDPTAAVAGNGDLTGIEGTFTATGRGFGGNIDVEVTISGGKITDAKAIGENETEGLGTVACEKIPAAIVTTQSIDVDAVAGATVSSTGIIEAFKVAFASAGVDATALVPSADAANVEKTDETLDVDVVIVGAGGAGMTAAIELTQAGKNVVILEKMPYTGGNTTKATGGMNAAETKFQEAEGIEDSIAQFVEDTMKGGKDMNDIDLVTKMAENSSDGIDWLESIGAPLPKVSFSGGATNARIHSPEDGSGVGAYLVNAFNKQIEELGINLLLETEATEILSADGKAVGVLAESPTVRYTINAKAVILATGGFGANEDFYTQYRPDLKGTVTTNAPGATGDGIVMAEALGADTVDMDQIQLHPTVEQSTSMLITEGVRGDGAILVNQSGLRFTNEMLTRDKVSAAELEQEGCYAYVVFDQNLRDGLKAIEKYVDNNLVVEAATIEELAEKLDIDPATLKNTLDTWNAAVASGVDEEFGRDTGMEADLSVAPYYAIKVAPGIHHTMGGVKINTNAEVISTDGNVIPGLFAAGEVTGGVHGGNRIGGNAVTDIVVYGRIAAASAGDYVDAN